MSDIVRDVQRKVFPTDWRRFSIRAWEFPSDRVRVTLFAESPTQWQVTLTTYTLPRPLELWGPTPEEALQALCAVEMSQPLRVLAEKALEELSETPWLRREMEDLWNPK